MDAQRFDSLTRSLSSDASRRRLLSGLASGLGAALATALLGRDADDEALATRRKRTTAQQHR